VRACDATRTVNRIGEKNAIAWRYLAARARVARRIPAEINRLCRRLISGRSEERNGRLLSRILVYSPTERRRSTRRSRGAERTRRKEDASEASRQCSSITRRFAPIIDATSNLARFGRLALAGRARLPSLMNLCNRASMLLAPRVATRISRYLSRPFALARERFRAPANRSLRDDAAKYSSAALHAFRAVT